MYKRIFSGEYSFIYFSTILENIQAGKWKAVIPKATSKARCVCRKIQMPIP
ncbi:hypothetical protein OENI_540008 [Oenococcus oeni]|nr:hypothetical protein OENI_540008 [Oenococcus oeni]